MISGFFFQFLGSANIRKCIRNILESFENKGLGKEKYDREIQNEMTRRLTEAIVNISTWSVVPFDIARALHNFSTTHAVPFEELKKIMESNFTAMENIKPRFNNVNEEILIILFI